MLKRAALAGRRSDIFYVLERRLYVTMTGGGMRRVRISERDARPPGLVVENKTHAVEIATTVVHRLNVADFTLIHDGLSMTRADGAENGYHVDWTRATARLIAPRDL